MNSWMIENAIRDLTGATNKLHEAAEKLLESIHDTNRYPRTVTVKDLCIATGLSTPSVHRAIQDGTLPGLRIGSKYVIPDLEFEAWRRGEWVPRRDAVLPARKMVHRLEQSEE